MAVLIINASSDLYGANRILLQTIKILKPRKIVLVLPSKGLLTESIFNDQQYNHVQVIISAAIPLAFRSMTAVDYIKVFFKTLMFKRLVRQIKKAQKIEWAYINTLSCFLTIQALHSLKIKVLSHVHEILDNNRPFTKFINKNAINYSDRIIAVSDAVNQNLVEVCTRNQQCKLTTVLNGIPDKYNPHNQKSSASQITVLLLARIKPEKGIWFFLDAIALLPSEALLQSKFLIIGSAAPGGDNYVQKLENDIKSHPAKENIEYRGFIYDVEKILNSSDIIVVPSLMKDPFPTTILEGLSAGKPIIATNTGGSVQSVKNNITGFLINPNDTQSFATCLKQLIINPQLRAAIGKGARKDFLENFTLEIFEKNFISKINSFEEAINKKHL